MDGTLIIVRGNAVTVNRSVGGIDSCMIFEAIHGSAAAELAEGIASLIENLTHEDAEIEWTPL